MPDYRLGADFAASLERFTASQQRKALRAIVNTLLDRARSPHVLTRGPAGEQWVREDGARCWRAYIEESTASARRLHFWRLPGGELELSRVVLHDDVTP